MKIRLTYFLTLLVLIICSTYCTAQYQLAPFYTFSQSSGSYSALSGGTQLGSGSGLNSQNYKINLPFTVNINGTNYDSCYVSVNGHIAFVANTSSTYWVIQSTSSGFAALAGFSCDLSGNTNSDIRYDVLGTSPNRELVVQWSDFRHAGTAALTANFQIRIKETTHEVKYVYGTVGVSNSSQLSVQVGVRGTSNAYYSCRSGNWSSSATGTINTTSLVTTSTNVPSSGTVYTYTPPMCTAPANQPTALTLTPGLNNVNISFTAASPKADKYLVVRTPNSALNTTPVNGTYYSSGNTLGNGTVVYAGPGTSANNTGLTQNTFYTYTVFAYDDTCLVSPVYKTTSPLTGTVQTNGPRRYVWKQTSGTHNAQADTNWIPLRSSTHNDDTLVFNQGGSVTLDNFTHTICSQYIITNSTQITLVGNSATSNRFLTIRDSFYLDTTSSITIGNTPLTLRYLGANTVIPQLKGKIILKGKGIYDAGGSYSSFSQSLRLQDSAQYIADGGTSVFNDSLILADISVYNSASGKTIHNSSVNLGGGSKYDLYNTAAITFNDTVNVYGQNARMSGSYSDSAVFSPGSVYRHLRDGGTFPTANFDVSSLFIVTHIVNTAPEWLSNTGNTVGEFIWNCPNQSAIINISKGVSTVKGNLHIVNTGGYRLMLHENTTRVNGNFIQNTGAVYSLMWTSNLKIHSLYVDGNVILNNGGVFDMNGYSYNPSGSRPILSIGGNLIQSPGHNIIATGYAGSIHFVSNVHQLAEFKGTISDTARISYSINNPNNVSLTGDIKVLDDASVVISDGLWIGPGKFTYLTGSKLSYSFVTANRPVMLTEKEWPATNGPTHVAINFNNREYPYNQVSMLGHRTVTGKFEVYGGILHLNDYNLIFDNGNKDDLKVGVSAFEKKLWKRTITASGNGYLIRKIDPTTTKKTYDFPIGDNSGNIDYSGVIIDVYDNDSARYIGVRVRDIQHSNNTNTTNTVKRYWQFTDSGTDTMTYRLFLEFPLEDDVPPLNKSMIWWDGSNWHDVSLNFNGVRKKEIGATDLFYYQAEMSGNKMTTDFPLKYDYTLGEKPFIFSTGQLYTWTGSVDKDYQKAGNWTPVRTSPSMGDSLRFNSGSTDTVENFKHSDTVRHLLVTNNTKVYFEGTANSGYGDTLSVLSDTSGVTDEIVIDYGSALYMVDSNTRFNLQMLGDSCNALISGTIELNGGTGHLQRYNGSCNGCRTIVERTGKLIRNDGSYFLAKDTNSYIIYGIVDNRFVYPDIGVFARWMDSSKMIMSGVKYSSYSSSYSKANFYDLEINSPNMPANCLWDYSEISVRNELKVVSTGSGDFAWRYTWYTKKYKQTGGKIQLSSLNISDSLLHTGGTINPHSLYQISEFIFSGTNERQYVSFHNASPGSLSCVIYNPYGIRVVGTGTMSTNLDLAQASIYADVDTPILTNLNIKYPVGEGSVSYNVNANYTLDTTYLLPATNGPAALSVSAGKDNVIHLYTPRNFKRINIGHCILDIGANDIVLGSSTTNYGQIYATGGGTISVDSGGSVTLWISSASSLYYATSLSNLDFYSNGTFPLSYKGAARGLSFYYTHSQPFASGGTMTVAPVPGAGFTTGLSVTDGTYTIGSRTNTKWVVSAGNGLALNTGKTMTMVLYAEGNGIGFINSIDSARIIKSGSVVGDHVNGLNKLPPYILQRKNLTINDINDTFYIGTAAGNMSAPYISVKSGNWNSGSTWNKGTVPGATDSVMIVGGHQVVIDTSCFAATLLVSGGGMLQVKDSTIKVDSNINNEFGTVAIQGGTLKLGPQGGGRADFRVYGGTVQIDSGRLEINGSLRLLRDYNVYSKYYQTGGDVILDGNAGGDTAKSVPAGTPILYVSGLSYNTTTSGGTITFVDPHAGTDPATSNVIDFGTDSKYFTGLDNMYFGDGISTDSGGHAYGFKLSSTGEDMGNKVFPNVTIQGSPSGKNRIVSHPGHGWNIAGNLNITGPGIVYQNLGSSLMIRGDIYVGPGAVFKSRGSIFFTNTYDLSYSSFGPATRAQRFYGPGTVLKDTVYTVATLYVNNSNDSGVSIEIGDFAAYNMRLEHGLVKINDTATLTVFNRIEPYPPYAPEKNYNGRVVGRMKQRITSTANYLLPLGDSIGNYTPIIATLSGVQNQGYLQVHAKFTEHPAVSSSKINPAQNANVQFVVDTAGGLVASNINLDLQWTDAIVDGGAYWPQFIVQSRRGSSWDDIIHTIPSKNFISLDSLNVNNVSGAYIMGEPGVSPVITQQPQNDTACSGTYALFSVVGSPVDSYRWQINTGSSWVSLANDTTYSGTNSANLYISSITTTMGGYKYRCILYNIYDTTISDAAILSVNTTVVPSITLTPNPNDTICAGTSVTFTAAITNGGNAPTYQWKKNGTPVGSNSNTYTNSSLANGDFISCRLTSNLGCAVPDTVTGSVTMTVTPVAAPSLTISPSPNDTICAGTSVTFTATPVLGGTAPSYQWILNGNNVGANSATYTNNGFSNNDIIRCVMTSNETCRTADTASARDTMTVNPLLAPAVTISPNPNDTICTGTAVTYTATPVNGGSTPSYQWKVNGTNVGTGVNYTSSSFNNNDIISCILTSSEACVTTGAANATDTVTVISSLTPAVTISSGIGDTVCAGASVVFTASPVNGGSAPTYQWRLNGSNVGTNSATYTNSGLSNGDTVKCVMTSSFSCANPDTAVSNSIVMVVQPVLTPLVSIAPSPNDTICAGTSVTFTATPVNGGTTPTYQWKLNGSNVGANGATYANAGFSNNDIVSCVMTSSYACPATVTAAAADTMVVIPVLTPTLSITPNPNDTICAGTSVTFTANPGNGGSTPAYQWKLNGTNVGTNSSTYINAVLSNNDIVSCVMTSSYACPSVNTATAADTMTVNPVLTTSVTITPNPNDTICAGTSVTYTAVAGNGGTSPVYQWKLNGSNVGTNSNTYTNGGFSNDDIVSCEVTSSITCPSSATVIASDTLVVNLNVTPMLAISPNPNDTVCAGTSVTFTATPTNGGTAPTYQWKLNAGNVGTGSSYTNNSFSNNDIVSCVMTSNQFCRTTDTASAADTMVTTPLVTPVVTIAVSPGNTICAGTSTTFTATPVNGGSPVYQWKVNGSNVGTNSSTYVSNSLSDNDVVTCVMSSSVACVTQSADTSNSITMTVNPVVTPVVTISVSPSNTICAGATATFTASPINGGTSPVYQWKLNGGNVGTNSATYANSSLANGDVVNCVMSISNSCATQSADTSNDITMTVNQVVTPSVTVSVSPNDTVCAGTPVAFTAAPANGGTSPSYQWKRNGVNVGTNSTTYTGTMVNNDVIYCVMTSSIACVSQLMDTSNNITMTVNPLITPLLTVSVSPDDTICAGTVVTFTATAVNGGTIPSYQWKLNGANVGNNSNTYSGSSFNNGNVITCELTSNAVCASPAAVTGNNVTMTVIPVVTPSVSVTAAQGVVVGPWTPITFTATPVNGGLTPAYQWKRNGIDIAGANNSIYSGSTNVELADGDVICVLLTSNATCPSPDTVSDCASPIQVNLSIDNVSQKRWRIYPNPNSGRFSIEIPDAVAGGELSITDMAGKIVKRITFNPSDQLEFVIGDLVDGVYIIRLTNGQDTYKGTVTIHR